MKLRRPFHVFPRMLAAGTALLPLLATAHPGHYHPPGEDDEFDAVTAAFQALPHWQSLAAAAIVLGLIVLAFRKRTATTAH